MTLLELAEVEDKFVARKKVEIMIVSVNCNIDI